MNRPLAVLRDAGTALRERLSAVAGQSERTILLGTALLLSAVSGTMCFALAQYYSVDAYSSLVDVPYDCWSPAWIKVGRHCFSDYATIADFGMQPNPWKPSTSVGSARLGNPYSAAAMVPHKIFALPAAWLHAPRLGLFGYLLALTIAVFTPAVWAARGARGLERLVVFVVCGAAAIPAWMVIDRANSVGFVPPLALVFLVALRRERWGLVAIAVVLAALVKPQFAVLAVALFAARQWRLGGIAVVGVVFSNLAAYLLWPRDFPQTIVESIHNALDLGGLFAQLAQWWNGLYNASFANGLRLILDNVAARAGRTLSDGFLNSFVSPIGYVVLIVVVACVLALGRRVPPVMVGIVLLATASLFAPIAASYYLVFAIPVAALVARDPDGPPGSGIFDRLATLGSRRRAVGICVSLAAALTVAQIVLPGPPFQLPIWGEGFVIVGTTPVVASTAELMPILWLVACTAIIVSYARKPAP